MLGKRLTLHVNDLLRGDETNPVLSMNATFGEALDTITRYKLGGTCLVDGDNRLVGLITDGDIRRILTRFVVRKMTVIEAGSTPVRDIMTKDPTSIRSDALAYDALKLMENHQPRPVFLLPVVDSEQRPIGLLHLHALVQAGFKTTVKD